MQYMMEMMQNNQGHHEHHDNNGVMVPIHQSPEDYEAYLKWCEEKRMAEAAQAQQKQLLEMYEKREEERKAEVERMRKEHEARERQEMMMAEYKSMERRLQETQQFETLQYNLMEMKHKYESMLTAEFLKFCKCSDFTEDLERFFLHDGVTVSNQEFNLDDLEGIDSTNPRDVAQALANRPVADQVKAFFGGLAESMCEGARVYVQQLVAY